MANVEFDPKTGRQIVNPALEGVENHVNRRALGALPSVTNHGPDPSNIVGNVRLATAQATSTDSKKRVSVLSTPLKADGGESSSTKPQVRRDMEKFGTTFAQQSIHELSILRAARASAKNLEVSEHKRKEKAEDAENDQRRDDARRRQREEENRIREEYHRKL